MDYIVMRRLPLGDRTLMPGDKIRAADVATWPHRRIGQLLEQRFVAPYQAPAAERPAALPDEPRPDRRPRGKGGDHGD